MSELTDLLLQTMDPGSAIGLIGLFYYVRGRFNRLDSRLSRLEDTHIPDGGNHD